MLIYAFKQNKNIKNVFHSRMVQECVVNNVFENNCIDNNKSQSKNKIVIDWLIFVELLFYIYFTTIYTATPIKKRAYIFLKTVVDRFNASLEPKNAPISIPKAISPA